MALLVFYVVFGVLMTVLKCLEITLDRNAERVRHAYSHPPAPTRRIRHRMDSGDQVE